jgi:hypothetical protein
MYFPAITYRIERITMLATKVTMETIVAASMPLLAIVVSVKYVAGNMKAD